eukprot:5722177-Pleurochrysis_carterae.AAC.5
MKLAVEFQWKGGQQAMDQWGRAMKQSTERSHHSVGVEKPEGTDRQGDGRAAGSMPEGASARSTDAGDAEARCKECIGMQLF